MMTAAYIYQSMTL